MHFRFLLAALIALSALPLSSNAQHGLADNGPYSAGIPTPREVLGYELGERFTPHHMMMRYLERLAAASPRIRIDTLGHTFGGREVVMAIVTSESNHSRMSDHQRGIATLAAAGTANASDVAIAEAVTPAVAWMGYTVHGNEASGTEAALALLYQMAAANNRETQLILDSVIVLVDPVQNPDGHERHVNHVGTFRGALGVPSLPGTMIHSGAWPGARTSHYFFDLNRDWFILSHPETRARIRAFTTWWPHVAVDLHEMGSNSTYFFAPPMEPVNKNVHSTIHKWWDIYAAANSEAFDREGWPYFRREGYDEFYPGYGVSWPILTGAVGMTYEQASSGAGVVRRSDGTLLTLHDAAAGHYTAAWATLLTTAGRRGERVADYAEFRRTAVTDAPRGGMRSVVIERDRHGRADSLAQRLMDNGIAVGTLASGAEVRNANAYGGARGTASLPSGAFVVDLAQPQGRLARAILEPDAQLDSSFIHAELESRRTGEPDRFYDLTAWSLPYTYRVNAWWTSSPVGGATPLAGHLTGGGTGVPARATYGYAFEPGSESSLRMLAGLLSDSVRVRYSRRGFTSGAADFSRGAFVVGVAANDSAVHTKVQRHAEQSGARVVALASAAADAGADLGSNSVIPIHAPRVALLGGPPVQGNSFGFTWYAFDQRLRYPAVAVSVGAVADGILRNFDVLVVPSASAGGLNSELGESGRERLGGWVRDGGVLITLDGATEWLASEQLGLSRLRLRRDTTRADSVPGAPLPASVPGAIVRATADTLSPLMAGVRETVLPVMVASDRIYTPPTDLRPGEVVIRYAPEPRLRLAGYMWPEVPARLSESPYLFTESVGRGRIIAFAGDPNFRDLWRGMLPIFANAVFLGSSF